MREHITPDDICNEILMSRSVRKGPVLLVEGVTDDRFYGKFTDPGVIIIECHSKDALIKSVKNLRLRGEDKTLGIADADLDIIDGKIPPQSVYFTDYRDMEMVCIYSGSLDDIINEYGNRDKIRQFTEKYGSVQNALTSAGFTDIAFYGDRRMAPPKPKEARWHVAARAPENDSGSRE